eukprot:458355-Pleurochrysis_carterae.AAC.2
MTSSATRSMLAGSVRTSALIAASPRVGLLSSTQNGCGGRPLRLPDELFRESTGSALSAVTVSCRGQPSSATPRGGPPSLRGTAPRGHMRTGDDGRAGAAPLEPAYHPLARRTSTSRATASAPPGTS